MAARPTGTFPSGRGLKAGNDSEQCGLASAGETEAGSRTSIVPKAAVPYAAGFINTLKPLTDTRSEYDPTVP